MSEKINILLENLQAKKIQFADVIAFIEESYLHTATAFKNGQTTNTADQNQGSAKVFAFAGLNNLSKEQTLSLFAEHYDAVLGNPEGTDHQNIRQFREHGWDGITFEGKALQPK
ncbi:HopJ type III effector protein [Sphingobacterium deserti]|uniref:HopJ type III effector protein n=1 Tax=Sphingobacterium deserti TaxID=1229276 RepID=A0A0B8T000_9SPHI|nr:HopJ type III effector protein [Sphingobacterium deserti]KGE13376.1 HopJ type III effector protein [Sphingobacterium deserti]